MITRINSENSQDYTVLFNKASAKLGLIPIEKEVNGEITYWKSVQNNDNEWELVQCEASELDSNNNLIINGEVSKGISSLNEYYQHIAELADLAIGVGRTGEAPYFLRIPVDEPYFEINANTRVISVPNELRQVGVVGDDLAEIVFFRINRYYDAVDLATRQIYIEWELPDGTKGISRDFLTDTQSDKDMIIFGWMIDNVLTAQAGTIRFSVRFIERYDDPSSSIVYSFSTLPATITVSNSLNYSLNQDEIAADELNNSNAIGQFQWYLKNSDPDIVDDVEPQLAAIPIFIKDIAPTANNSNIANLVNGSYELVAQAYAEDGGSISYKFGYKAAADGGTVDSFTGKTKFIPADLSNGVNQNTTYYIQEANGIYSVTDNIDIESDTQYYEKVGYVIVRNPGFYTAEAKNRVFGLKENSNKGNQLEIPYAKKPVISGMPTSFVINEKVYEDVIDDEIDQTSVGDENKSNIKITVADAIDKSATILLQPFFAQADEGQLTYQWYYSRDNEEMENAEPISGETGNTLIASNPGYYSVKATNSFNNSIVETSFDEAGICRVTEMPILPVIDFEEFETRLIVDDDPQPALIVPEVEHDHIRYEWHKITSDNNDRDPIAEGDLAIAEGELQFTDGFAEIPFSPMAPGKYYFLLFNELNGAEAIMNSADYQIISVQVA